MIGLPLSFVRAAGLLLAVTALGVIPGCAGSSSTHDGAGGGTGTVAKFSFFVTSWASLQRVSGSLDGFGGDLRHGETGAGAGLRGADKICAEIAEASMPGAGKKGWRAFLSAADGGAGKPVNAIDRIGAGPWFDRLGRLFGNDVADIRATRPTSADAAIKNDFPNEDGVPNHQPDPTAAAVDNHDMLTGSDASGRLYGPTATCLDWTSAIGDTATEGQPRVGHSWPRGLGTGADGGLPASPPDGGLPSGLPEGGFPGDGGPGFPDGGFFEGGAPGFPDGGPPVDGTNADVGDVDNWMSSLTESGCKAGANLVETGGPLASAVTVGSGGGYGGFYCFALSP